MLSLIYQPALGDRPPRENLAKAAVSFPSRAFYLQLEVPPVQARNTYSFFMLLFFFFGKSSI